MADRGRAEDQPIQLSGSLAWDIFGWVGGLVAAFLGPRWLVLVVVVAYVLKDVAASRLIYWQREYIDVLKENE